MLTLRAGREHRAWRGIVFQLAAITIYVALASEFLWHCFMERPVGRHSAASDDFASDEKETAEQPAAEPHVLTRRLRLMIFGLSFSTLCIFVRSVYRAIELANGWTGRIITIQVYFSEFSAVFARAFKVLTLSTDVLDGAMIVLAMYTLNVFHPGLLLGREWD